MAEHAGHPARVPANRRPAGVHGRAALAATLGASYGIYGPAFELAERTPREAGTEEYLDSEKYQLRRWDSRREDSLREFLARLNTIRRDNPGAAEDETLTFRAIDNEQLICYSKHSDDVDNLILVVVNLDPHHPQSGFIEMPLDEWAARRAEAYQAHELFSGASYEWHGPRVFVALSPAECPACVYRIQARRSASERDFDYFV